jgi:AraC-like DNA-binding protein
MTPATDLALNLLLRGAGFAMLVFMAAVLLREHPRAVPARLGAAFATGTALAALVDAPGIDPTGWRWAVAAIAGGNMFVFWLFTRSLFDDAFTLRPWHALAWGPLALLGALNCLYSITAIGTGLMLATIALALLSVAQSASAWREDLVEGRRRVRVTIVGSASTYAALVAAVALAPGLNPHAAFSSLANAAGLAGLSFAVAWQLLRLGRDNPFIAPAVPTPVLSAEPPRPVLPGPPSETEADPALVSRLDHLMAIERVYREPEISIGTLARRMALPEHRLRKLINRGLGYRNFSAFLNGYRIADAKAALADAARSEAPVLTIAMDAGFQSLGPFNRAFKEITGTTPSEYRRARQAGSSLGSRLAETEID